MRTINLTEAEVRFVETRLQLAAMNEGGDTAAMADRVLDVIAATRPQRTIARNMDEVIGMFLTEGRR